MAKVYEFEYKIDVKDDIVKRKDEIVRSAGRFWEHAITEPKFKYDLPVGDVLKAKAIGALLKLLVGKGKKMVKVKQKVIDEGG